LTHLLQQQLLQQPQPLQHRILLMAMQLQAQVAAAGAVAVRRSGEDGALMS
jgi:hypothetical protein